MISRLLVPGVLIALGVEARAQQSGAEAVTARAAQLLAGAPTAYVSDYVSFAGADARGRVAFALDTNRGRDGGEYQAEHFVAMYDERSGWVELEGDTDFPNDAGRLLEWPESPHFRIEGSPYAPGTLRSPPNGLVLEIGRLEPRTTSASETTLLSMASAPAVLRWRGRTIAGRVIYEYLAMRGANRLSAGIGGALAILTGGPDFQGLYLAGDDEDLYMHRAPAAAAATTGEPLTGFWARDGADLPVADLALEVTDHDAALGLYRWPAAWRASWNSECGEAELDVESLAHDTQTNWVTGGFAMRAVEAQLQCGGEKRTLFGFAELIR